MLTRCRSVNKPPALPVPRPRLSPAAPEHIYWPFKIERPETSGSGHFHWGITAFSKLEDGNFLDSLSIEVEAPDEETAIARAQDIIIRPNYRVSWVREACTKDAALKE